MSPSGKFLGKGYMLSFGYIFLLFFFFFLNIFFLVMEKLSKEMFNKFVGDEKLGPNRSLQIWTIGQA